MSREWMIHSGTQTFGPWSASRIRDELRAGRIDAFDFVSEKGSPVKRPIVEVDEIFESSRVQPAALLESVAEGKQRGAQFAVSGDDVRTKSNPSHPVREIVAQRESAPAPQKADVSHTSDIRPRAFEALASPERVAAPAQPRAFKSPRSPSPVATNPRAQSSDGGRRHYVLIAQGARPQGPFTSREILALWYGKKLSADVKVRRGRDQKTIDIARFVRFYENAAPSGVAFLGRAHLAGGYFDQPVFWLLAAIILGILMVGGALYWRLATNPFVTEQVHAPGAIPARGVPGVPGSMTGLKEPQPQSNGLNPRLSGNPQSGVAAGKDSQVPSESRENPPISKVGTNASRGPSVSRGLTSSGARSRVVPPKTSYRNDTRNPPRASVPSAARPVQTIRPATRTVIQPAPQRSQSAGNGGGFQWVDGAVVTLPGYRFHPAQLNACDLKCKIPMAGPRGPVIAVFFKEAFGSQLAGKASGVTLTGSVRRDPATGAVQILVQSVR